MHIARFLPPLPTTYLHAYTPLHTNKGVNATMAVTPACAFDPLLTPECASQLVGKDYFEHMYQVGDKKGTPSVIW